MSPTIFMNPQTGVYVCRGMSRRWWERYRYGFRGLVMIAVLFLVLLAIVVFGHYFFSD